MWLAASRIRSLGRDDSANNDRDVFSALLIPTYIQGKHSNFKNKKSLSIQAAALPLCTAEELS
jgi:hypothetical protein